MSNTLSYRSPAPCVDLIIEDTQGRVLVVNRPRPPLGWALPGGFIEYGESLAEAALREARDKTGLEVELLEQFHTYSNPGRDSRMHAVSTVLIARPKDPASVLLESASARFVPLEALPALTFDHEQMVRDYSEYKKTGRRPQL